MRIAYIAPYQGPTLLRRRPIVTNLSLGAKAKIEQIADLLRDSGHDVEILSQGEVERQIGFYPEFSENELFNCHIPIYYSSALPIRFVSGAYSSMSTLGLLKARHKAAPFDLILIYNLKSPQVTCANYAMRHLGVPVVLEYEDDAFIESFAPNGSRLTSRLRLVSAKRLLGKVSGCMAGSAHLLSQVVDDVPKLLLPGTVGEEIVECGKRESARRKNWVIFSGTHSRYQGLEQLLKAWKREDFGDWKLHIAGKGEITDRLHKLAGNDSRIFFHGVLDRKQNAELLSYGKISVVAYDVNRTRGFSFKTLECLGAGMHVITTRLSALEALAPEIKVGLTYINDDEPETIAASLKWVINEQKYEQTARTATLLRYGPSAVARSLKEFMSQFV